MPDIFYADSTSITLGFIGWTTHLLFLVIEFHTNIASKHDSALESEKSTRFLASSKGLRLVAIFIALVIATLLYGKI